MGDMKKFRKRRPDESIFDFMDDFLMTHLFLSLFIQVCFSGLCFGIAFLIEKTLEIGTTSGILIASGLCLITLVIMKIVKLVFNIAIDLGPLTPWTTVIFCNACIIFCVLIAIIN